MIRRAFWLVLGAALGITGYRRLDRLASSIAPRWLRTGTQEATGLGRRAALRPARPDALPAGHCPAIPAAQRSTKRFLSDVREGMAEYIDRHPGRSGNTLEGQRAADGPRMIPGSDNPKDGR